MEGREEMKGTNTLCETLRNNFALFAVKFWCLIFFVGFTTAYSQETAKTNTAQTTTPKNTGKISHHYKAKGIAVVINISTSEGDIILIPKTPLAKEFDVNGLEIKFDYKLLRVPSPKGCPKAHYAVISNISKK